MALTWSGLRLGAFVLLAAGAAGLGYLIYAELTSGAADQAAEAAAPASPAAGSAATAPAGGFAMPPASAYRSVTERPIFAPSRRPTVRDAPEAVADAVSFNLVGIVISGEDKIALISQAQTQGKGLQRIKEGQTIGGWTVQAIEQDRVVLERDAGTHELKLTDKEKTPRVPAPPTRRQNQN
jgi:hypothetical protein